MAVLDCVTTPAKPTSPAPAIAPTLRASRRVIMVFSPVATDVRCCNQVVDETNCRYQEAQAPVERGTSGSIHCYPAWSARTGVKQPINASLQTTRSNVCQLPDHDYRPGEPQLLLCNHVPCASSLQLASSVAACPALTDHSKGSRGSHRSACNVRPTARTRHVSPFPCVTSAGSRAESATVR